MEARKKPRRYSEEEKERIIRDYEQERENGSQQSQREYCQGAGISISSLKQWLKKKKGSRFVEVKVSKEIEETKGEKYRLGNGVGMWVEFGGDFDGKEILSLANILREAGKC
jgi:transposase-like protein